MDQFGFEQSAAFVFGASDLSHDSYYAREAAQSGGRYVICESLPYAMIQAQRLSWTTPRGLADTRETFWMSLATYAAMREKQLRWREKDIEWTQIDTPVGPQPIPRPTWMGHSAIGRILLGLPYCQCDESVDRVATSCRRRGKHMFRKPKEVVLSCYAAACSLPAA